MDTTRVFVGSSREDVELAKIIQAELNDVATVRRWDQSTFDPGVFALERLIEMVNEYDFAIFVIGANDIADLRGKRVLVARDNVLFEAGLFFSQLDRKRVFLVKPDKPSSDDVPPFHLPSDLQGLTLVQYSPPDRPDDLEAKIGAACLQIEKSIKKQGPRPKEALRRIDSLQGGPIFLLRHIAERPLQLTEATCILKYFNDAEGDASIAWSKATHFAVQTLSLLELIEFRLDGWCITDSGKEFLADPVVKGKCDNEFDKELCPLDILVVCETARRFACPSFKIHIKANQLNVLQDGKIPPEAELSGEGGWEDIFDLPAPTARCKWEDVVSKLESPEPWIYPLAILMWQAYDRQRIQYPSVGVRIKLFNRNGDEYRVFRLCLQKVDAKQDEADFAFVVAAVLVPYEPANNPTETRLYHLFNLAWFFRRRLLERELDKLEFELLNIPSKEQIASKEQELKKIIREISNDFRTLLADAQVRGMEQEAAVIQSFKSPLREEVKTRLFQEWPKLYKELLGHLEVGVPAAELIKETLDNMKPINRFFLKVSIEELNKIWAIIDLDPKG
jgi:hypothetical protein